MSIARLSIVFTVTLSVLFGGPAFALETVNYLIVSEVAKPFQIEANDVSNHGVVTDIVEEIFSGSDFKLTHMVFPITRLHHEVAKKMVTNWVSYDAKAWQSFGAHGELIDIPLFEVTHALLTCDERINLIEGDSDLTRLKIATLADFQYLRLDALAKEGKVLLVPVNGYESGILMSQHKRVHGFVEMEIRLNYNVAELGLESDCLRYVDFGKIIPPYSIYLTVDREMSDNTKQFIRQRLMQMKQSGVLDRIYSHWIQ